MVDTGLGNEDNGVWRNLVAPLRQAPGIRIRGSNNFSVHAKENRLMLTDYFSNEGQIDWQDQYL